MKKKIIIPVLTILGISLILVGTSYAYWRFTYISDKTNIGKSKCLSIELTNQKNEISLTNTYPITDLEAKKLTPYSFTINNTCDTFISYDVNLEMLEGTTMNSKYMAVMINNEHKELLSNLDNANTVMSSSVESRKLVSGSLGVGDSVDYTLRLWMDESVTLSDDAMNKNFTSKIVVTAQPSNYSPKEAGYDTLLDAILANEYQTTPEKAIEKIKAKDEVDLSKTAPIIKWVEKTSDKISKEVTKPALSSLNIDDVTSNLTENDTKLKLYTSYTFNNETGKYHLSNPMYIDPTEINFNSNVKYYIQNDSISFNQSTNKLFSSSNIEGPNIYSIEGATKANSTAIWNNKEYDSIVYNLNLTTLTEVELEVDKSDKGLYQALDDYGTTYYYRGNVKNNNVYFAGVYWQIIRINGDCSIRLIYNGTEHNAIGLNQSINNKIYKFNNEHNSSIYVGYMYGNYNASTFNESFANINDSDIKKTVDEWYKLNIEKNFGQYISSNAGFCGDRSVYLADNNIPANKNIYFGSFERFNTNDSIFICPDKDRDLYTTSDSDVGNKSLIYPVGLITYDELIFAGMVKSNLNKLSYAYSSQNYWTMSPAYYEYGPVVANIWSQNGTGYLYPWTWSNYGLGVRPVINLKSDVKITGGIGTSNDPYVIDTNN